MDGMSVDIMENVGLPVPTKDGLAGSGHRTLIPTRIRRQSRLKEVTQKTFGLRAPKYLLTLKHS
jgi:hypothetical protein